MAETTLNLGKIAMLYKGTWSASTAYKYLDIVKADGVTYLCIGTQGAPAGTAVTDAGFWAVLVQDGAPGISTDVVVTERVQALGSRTGTVSVDCSAGNVVSFTLTDNVTLSFIVGAGVGTCRVLTFIVLNGGQFTITWPAAVRWPDAVAPVLKTGGYTIVNFLTVDNGAVWFGFAGGGFAAD